MTNFQIIFSEPLWLLLLIPALFFALFPFFRLAKKYRRNRNRVISVVLHCLILVLCVLLVAGIGFTYQIPNTDNEIILLVDVSHSSRESQKAKDEFVASAIEDKSSTMRMGIVTFGYDQVYAAPLNFDGDVLYEEYLAAELPDTSATDFESALQFASALFEHPESGKIVVISDGDETDGNALSLNAINAVSAQGIKVDTVFFPNENTENEVRIVGITYPETPIKTGEPFELKLNLQSSYRGLARFTMSDNENVGEEQLVELSGEVQSVTLQHTFELPGLHELGFRITSDTDTLTENNVYHSYYYLQEYDDILVIEREEGDSEKFVELLTTSEYVPTVVTPDSAEIPMTVDELRMYDEVVLFNIAYSDMPQGFEEALHSYVYDVGGSVLTVGGNRNENGQIVSNAYNREDMAHSTYYRQMLPVEAIDYTPPVGVVFIIDRSGSMTGKLELAKQGVKQALNALSSRDYVGIMTLEDEYSEDVAITSMTDVSSIRTIIDDIETGGGTQYKDAIERAGRSLSMLNNVQKRHIVIISDSAPGDPAYEGENEVTGEKTGGYVGAIRQNYNLYGITCSVVCIGNSTSAAAQNLQDAVSGGVGHYYSVEESEMYNLNMILREDLLAPEILEYDETPFQPRIHDLTSAVTGIAQADIPQLGGYYGTRIKKGAEQALVTSYGDAPVYAQWDYGAGKVGSFMSDLYGTQDSWSADFMQNETGIRLLNNILVGLYPSEDIRSKDIYVELTEQNYTTSVAIVTSLAEGDTVEMTVTGPVTEDGAQAEIQVIAPNAADYFSSASFTVRAPGIYTILVTKKDAEGNIVSSTMVYKAFSYSAEYNVFEEEEVSEVFMEKLAEDGGGSLITDSRDIFESLIRTLERSFDPRILFIILIIVMFLLDVAVRKFKFKWPHEIVRDYKEKKRLMEDNRSVRPGRSTK